MSVETRTIMVVDDDPDIVMLLQILLEDAGYHVVTSESGEAVEQLQVGSLPHLIILDMFLSGKDGRELARSLKRRRETQHIPVLMISAHPAGRQEALSAGAEDFLAKPFEIEDLLKRVRTYLC